MSPLRAWQMMKGWNKWYQDMMKAREQAPTALCCYWPALGAVGRQPYCTSVDSAAAVHCSIIGSSTGGTAHHGCSWQMRAVAGALRRMMNRKLSMAWEQWQQATPSSAPVAQ